MNRSYSELERWNSFEERFNYLTLKGSVGRSTFGFDRYLNQQFYISKEWRDVRNTVIARDLGCDLGLEGFEIHKGLYIHHMNPIKPNDLIQHNADILNPEYLITVTHATHNAIHYGVDGYTPRVFHPRRPGDTKLW